MSVEQELRTYLEVLWRRKWMIATCGIIAALVALSISLLLTPRYLATAVMRAASVPSEDSVYYINSSVLTRLTNTLIEIANSDSNLYEVASEFGLLQKPDVEVEIIPETELITISASDPDPFRARDIANEVAHRMILQSEQFYGDTIISSRRMDLLTVIDPASIPQRPATPVVPLNVVLGLFAGLAMGVILAFLFEGMDNTLRGIEDVQAITTLPILSTIPEIKRGLRRNANLHFSNNGHYALAPGFDQLGARLILSYTKSKPTKFLITSPEPGVGKSTIAANLAMSLAEAGKQVMLIDMDFRRPRLHTIFGLPNENGLTDYSHSKITLAAMLQKETIHPKMHIVTTGSSKNIPPEWMTPEIISTLFESLGEESDYLLVDSPALLSVADPIMLASQVDGVILVVAKRKTERQQLSFALQQLNQLEVEITGIVVNRVPNNSIYYYYDNASKKQTSHQQGKARNQETIDVRVNQADLGQE